MSSSECSSGCESGWTTYLDHSSVSPFQYDDGNDKSHRSRNNNTNNQQVEDDSSMLSDASSGPTNFYQPHTSSTYFSASEQGKKRPNYKIKDQKQGSKVVEDYYLDDTASSHVLTLYKDNKGFMEQETHQQHSASHYKGKSVLKQQFGLLKSSVSGKSASQKSGSLQGRKRQ